MKEENFAHMGSLMGGMVHNLNTPLMWVMGRAQLLQARNDRFDTFRDLSEEELVTIREKNNKDITSIQEGAEKIDHMLKALSYKVQMIHEGRTSIELREYLEMEIDFLMADMRFKHETKREISLDSRSCYVKGDYNVISHAVTGIINWIINSTEKGRTLRIALENGIIRLGCPGLKSDAITEEHMKDLCRGLKDSADIIVDDSSGFEISLCLKDA